MQAILKRLSTWLFQFRGPQQGPIILVQRRIFILPARAGFAFALMLLLMLSGSINYSLSLGFILTFLLASLAITAMLHTFRNLAGLHVSATRATPVFAGQTAHFGICLHNPTRTERHSVVLTHAKGDPHVVDVPAEQFVIATAAVPALRRGILRPGRMTLSTRFPVGIYNAWSYIDLDTQCVVYPQPAPPGLPLPPFKPHGGEGGGQTQGREDFAGLRQYHPGDSLRHIAWKAAARDRGLLTKQFSGHAAAELWLTLDLPPPTLDIEEKLSRLARWVLDADASGHAFGLVLPHTTVPLGAGEAHRERCLEALALFEPQRQRAGMP